MSEYTDHDDTTARQRFAVDSERTRRNALMAVAALPVPGRSFYVEVGESEMRLPWQVRRVFKRCGELATQLPFPGFYPVQVHGDAEAWYRFLLGLMRGERFAREGLVIVQLGGGLSHATKVEADSLLHFIESYGAQRGVRFEEDPPCGP